MSLETSVDTKGRNDGMEEQVIPNNQGPSSALTMHSSEQQQKVWNEDSVCDLSGTGRMLDFPANAGDERNPSLIIPHIPSSPLPLHGPSLETVGTLNTHESGNESRDSILDSTVCLDLLKPFCTEESEKSSDVSGNGINSSQNDTQHQCIQTNLAVHDHTGYIWDTQMNHIDDDITELKQRANDRCHVNHVPFPNDETRYLTHGGWPHNTCDDDNTEIKQPASSSSSNTVRDTEIPRQYQLDSSFSNKYDFTYMPRAPNVPSNAFASSLPEGKEFHAFFCYSQTEQSWVLNVIRKLESVEYGFRCCYHERDFKPGARITENIDYHIQKSVKTILVLSPDFIASDWCTYETELVMHISVEQRKRLLIPVLVEECTVPGTIKPLTYIDALSGDDWWEKLLEALLEKDELTQSGGNVLPLTRTWLLPNPNHENMEFLCEVKSSDSCLGERMKVPYIPDTMTSPEIGVSVEEYIEAVDSIIKVSYPKRWLFCNTLGCGYLFLFLTVICTFVLPTIVFVLSANNNGLRQGSYDWFYANITVLLPGTVVGYFMICGVGQYVRRRSLQRVTQDVNRVLLLHKVLTGCSVSMTGCRYFCLRVSFWYYDTKQCQDELSIALLNRKGPKLESLIANDIEEGPLLHEPTSDYQEEAFELILKHSQDYISCYFGGKLAASGQQWHVKRVECLCQFIKRMF